MADKKNKEEPPSLDISLVKEHNPAPEVPPPVQQETLEKEEEKDPKTFHRKKQRAKLKKRLKKVKKNLKALKGRMKKAERTRTASTADAIHLRPFRLHCSQAIPPNTTRMVKAAMV